LADHEDAWVQATLTDDLRPTRAMARLRDRFPHALALHFEPASTIPTTASPSARSRGGSDHDIALDFVSDLRAVPATEAEAALLRDACDSCCDDPDADVRLTEAATR
ncbi:MAG: exonuclease SbcCD subunit D C-terminal domain-containing protein, partial [Nocardioides sp.]